MKFVLFTCNSVLSLWTCSQNISALNTTLFTSLQCCFTLDLTQKLQFKAAYTQEFHKDSTKCEDRLRHPTIDSSLMLSYSMVFLFGEKETQVLPLSSGKGSAVQPTEEQITLGHTLRNSFAFICKTKLLQ